MTDPAGALAARIERFEQAADPELIWDPEALSEAEQAMLACAGDRSDAATWRLIGMLHLARYRLDPRTTRDAAVAGAFFAAVAVADPGRLQEKLRGTNLPPGESAGTWAGLVEEVCRHVDPGAYRHVGLLIHALVRRAMADPIAEVSERLGEFLLQESVRSSDPSWAPGALGPLGAGLLRLYEATGEREVIDDAVHVLLRAALGEPAYTRDLAAALALAAPGDDELARAYLAAAESGPGDPDRSRALLELVELMRARSVASCADDDLLAFIRVGQCALDFWHERWAHPGVLAPYASGLIEWYVVTGDERSLEAGMEMLDALRVTPDEDVRELPDPLVRLRLLGDRRMRRYDVTGDPADLESAVEARREAVGQVPDGHPARAALLASLAGALLRLAAATGGDPAEPIAAARAALAAHGEHDPARPDVLLLLGQALTLRLTSSSAGPARPGEPLSSGACDGPAPSGGVASSRGFASSGGADSSGAPASSGGPSSSSGPAPSDGSLPSAGDADEAIAVLREALAAEERLAGRVEAYGLMSEVLRWRAARADGDRRAADLREAVQAARRAVELAAKDARGQAGARRALEEALLARYTAYGDPRDLTEALSLEAEHLAPAPASDAPRDTAEATGGDAAQDTAGPAGGATAPGSARDAAGRPAPESTPGSALENADDADDNENTLDAVLKSVVDRAAEVDEQLAAAATELALRTPSEDRALTLLQVAERRAASAAERGEFLSEAASRLIEAGRTGVAGRVLERAAQAFEAAGERSRAADALTRLARLSAPAAPERALAAYERAAAAHHDLGDPSAEARELTGMGLLHLASGDPARAAELHLRAAALCEQAGLPADEAVHQRHAAQAQLAAGDPDAAVACAARARDLHHHLDEPVPAALALVIAARAALDQGDLTASGERITACAIELEAAGAWEEACRVLDAHAVLLAGRGHPGQAAACETRLVEVVRRHGLRREPADEWYRIAQRRRARGDAAGARVAFELAGREYDALGNPDGAASVRYNLGVLAYGEGEAGQAMEAFGAAAETFAQLDDPVKESIALTMRAACLTALGSPDDALIDLDRALEAAGSDRYALLIATLGRAAADVELGDLQQARERLRAALPLAGDDRLAEGVVRDRLAALHGLAGELDAQVPDLEAALSAFRDAGRPWLAALTAVKLGFALEARGELRRARHILETALTTLQPAPTTPLPGEELFLKTAVSDRTAAPQDRSVGAQAAAAASEARVEEGAGPGSESGRAPMADSAERPASLPFGAQGPGSAGSSPDGAAADAPGAGRTGRLLGGPAGVSGAGRVGGPLGGPAGVPGSGRAGGQRGGFTRGLTAVPGDRHAGAPTSGPAGSTASGGGAGSGSVGDAAGGWMSGSVTSGAVSSGAVSSGSVSSGAVSSGAVSSAAGGLAGGYAGGASGGSAGGAVEEAPFELIAVMHTDLDAAALSRLAALHLTLGDLTSGRAALASLRAGGRWGDAVARLELWLRLAEAEAAGDFAQARDLATQALASTLGAPAGGAASPGASGGDSAVLSAFEGVTAVPGASESVTAVPGAFECDAAAPNASAGVTAAPGASAGDGAALSALTAAGERSYLLARLSFYCRALGDLPAAYAYAAQGCELGDERVSEHLRNLGAAALELGRVEEAITHLGAAAERAREASPIQLAGSLALLGDACSDAARWSEAAQAYEEGLALTAPAVWRPLRIPLLAGRAALHLRLGELDAATARYREAIALGEELARHGGLATAYADLALVHELRGDPAGARPLAERALDLARAHNDARGTVLALIALARLGTTEARRWLEEAAELAREAGYRAGEAVAQRHLAALDLAEGAHDRARHRLRTAIDVLAGLGHDLELREAHHLSSVAAEHRGDLPAALDDAERACALGHAPARDRALRLAVSLGRGAAAWTYAEQARLAVLAAQLGDRPWPPPPGVPADLLQAEDEALTAVSTLTSAAARTRDPDRAARLVQRARTALAGLEGVWQRMRPSAPHHVALRRHARSPQKHVTGPLKHGAEGPVGMLAFHLDQAAGTTTVLAHRTGWPEPRAFTTDVGRELLDDFLHATYAPRPGLLDIEARRRRADAWRRLGDGLLADALPALDGQAGDLARLHLLPGAGWHGVPLHALALSGGRPLIERCPVTYDTVTSADGGAPARRGAPLVVGFSTDGGERPAVEESGALLGTLPVTGRDAVSARLPGVRPVLHLATPVVLDERDPFGSGVRLADGLLTARHLMTMNVAADLVMLTPHTATVMTGTATAVAALAHAFLRAGARRVLLTLWPVAPEITAALVRDLLSRVRTGDDPAEALRAAVLGLRELYGPAEPDLWASYVLIGPPDGPPIRLTGPR
ncbi:CHAT domain-containing tetratricopeptide repeat protein [Nonomuraea sp. NPDC052634]|uniref:CHAT domain-containing tetratricopeptide repeat protein n=1 Tax=Nonomuraea sp. NPDC052634 TaxID=3155813 RepID=UPI003444E611